MYADMQLQGWIYFLTLFIWVILWTDSFSTQADQTTTSFELSVILKSAYTPTRVHISHCAILSYLEWYIASDSLPTSISLFVVVVFCPCFLFSFLGLTLRFLNRDACTRRRRNRLGVTTRSDWFLWFPVEFAPCLCLWEMSHHVRVFIDRDTGGS